MQGWQRLWRMDPNGVMWGKELVAFVVIAKLILYCTGMPSFCPPSYSTPPSGGEERERGARVLYLKSVPVHFPKKSQLVLNFEKKKKKIDEIITCRILERATISLVFVITRCCFVVAAALSPSLKIIIQMRAHVHLFKMCKWVGSWRRKVPIVPSTYRWGDPSLLHTVKKVERLNKNKRNKNVLVEDSWSYSCQSHRAWSSF